MTVNIADQVATTSVDQEFHNPNGQVLEGTYIFPLPAGAHIDKFSMDINGSQADAELLDADKARALYEETVRKYRDPALLEYAGRGAMRVRIFPIEAHGSKHIKLQYTQALTADSGLIEYVYPLNTEKFSSRPLRDVSVTVNITGKGAIKSVYCPSHVTSINRNGEASENAQSVNTTLSGGVLSKMAAATPPEASGYRNTTNYTQQSRLMNGRAFYQNNNVWTDSTIQENTNLKQAQIRINSDEHFALLRDHPEVAGWLLLGDEVDVLVGDTVVSVR